MNRIDKFKELLAIAFDDKLCAKKWKRFVDYILVGLIIISTVGVFLSTYDGIVEKYGELLRFVDYFTTICFTIEVSLRIWVADKKSAKYKDFRGRVRYCFSFYGLIDILSTFPFYVDLFVPVPYMAMKALRVVRVLLVFRYVNAFGILTEAIKVRKRELAVMLQFLVVVTLILSFILFSVEHKAQPDVYDNGWKSVVWAFVQYIGDPGHVADAPPVTYIGQLIASVIGVLKIAIFAVPAGLIGSAFTLVIERKSKAELLKKHSHRINEYMLLKSVRRVNMFFPAKNVTVGDLRIELGLSDAEIIKAVSSAKNLRLKNLADAINSGTKNDMVVVNQFYVNTKYGSCIDRSSSITIVNPLGYSDNGLSFFDWHIAQIGGLNYVSNEFFSRMQPDDNYRCNFYTVENPDNSSFKAFIEDITRGKGKNDWIVIIAGEQIVKGSPYGFHFELGGEHGEKSFDFEGCIPWNHEVVRQLYEDFAKTLEEKAQVKTDLHEVQPKVRDKNLARYLKTQTDANVLLLTVSYNLMVFNENIYEAIIGVAKVLKRNLEADETKKERLNFDEYKARPIESQYWQKLYLCD